MSNVTRRAPPPPPNVEQTPRKGEGGKPNFKGKGEESEPSPPPLPERKTVKPEDPRELENDYEEPVAPAQKYTRKEDFYEEMVPNTATLASRKPPNQAAPPVIDLVSSLEKALQLRNSNASKHGQNEPEKPVLPRSTNLSKNQLTSPPLQSNNIGVHKPKDDDDETYEEPGPTPKKPSMINSSRLELYDDDDDDTDDDWGPEEWDDPHPAPLPEHEIYEIPDGANGNYVPPDLGKPPPLPPVPRPSQKESSPKLSNASVSDNKPHPSAIKQDQKLNPSVLSKPTPPKKPVTPVSKIIDTQPPLPPRAPDAERNKSNSRSDDSSSAESTTSCSDAAPFSLPDLRNQKVRVLPDMPKTKHLHHVGKPQKLLPSVPLPKEKSAEEEQLIYDDAASENITNFEWFHPNVDRNEAAKRVNQLKGSGSFLVRTSMKEKNQPYTLVVLYDGEVKNLPLRLRNDKRFAIGNFKADEVSFASVLELITHHKSNNIMLSDGRTVQLTKTPPKR